MAFNKVALAFNSFDTRADVGFKSSVLNDIIFSLSVLKQPMKDLINEVSLKKAAEGRKDTMWINPEKYPQIADIDLVSFCSTYIETCSHGSKGNTNCRS